MRTSIISFTALALLTTTASFAADFCVSSAAQLQAALNVADNNGQSDTVRIVQGAYAGTFLYNANVAETGDLSIGGGYNAACTARQLDASNTTLDGAAAGRTLTVSGRDNSNLAISGITVTGGVAALGGSGIDVDRWVNATLSDNVFVGNQATVASDGVGGANIDRTASIDLARNEFRGNRGGQGGGLDASDYQSARLDSNVFIGNLSEQGGGGLSADSAGRMTMTNNVFARNESLEDAGGVDAKLSASGSLDMTNNTVTSNTAAGDGGGVSVKMIGDAPVASLFNNIIYANSAGLLGRDLEIDNDDEDNGIAAAVTLLNNDFDQGLGFFIKLAIAIDPSNLNNANPLFAGAAADDYHLTATSPVIDKGTLAAPEMTGHDADGLPRVQGVTVDMGAYEFAADSDDDGVADIQDNCTEIANPDQRDTNGDGFGNICDPDLNNDGVVNPTDLGLMRLVFFSADPDADFNGDGVVNPADLGVMRAFFFGAPGPSGTAP